MVFRPFDVNGNQQIALEPGDVRTTNTWDYENLNTRVQLPSGTIATYTWNADSKRTAKNVDGTETKMLWAEENILLETGNTDATQVVYTLEPQVYGNVVSERRKNGLVWAPSYYHFDALGSTRNLTDSGETVNDTWIYDAWGNIVSHTGTSSTPLLWIGEFGLYFNAETGIYLVRKETYEPSIGRTLSVLPAQSNTASLSYIIPFPLPIPTCIISVRCARIGFPLGPKHCGIRIIDSKGADEFHVTANACGQEALFKKGVPGGLLFGWWDAATAIFPPNKCDCLRFAIFFFTANHQPYCPVPSNFNVCKGCDAINPFGKIGKCKTINTVNSNYATRCVLRKCGLEGPPLFPFNWGIGGEPIGWSHLQEKCVKFHPAATCRCWCNLDCQCRQWELADVEKWLCVPLPWFP